MPHLLRALVPLLVLPALVACGGEGPAPEVRDARLPAPAGDQAAVYLTVVDRGGAGDRLVGASCDAAGHVMLHETRHDGGRVRMIPVDAFAVPPGGTLELRPGAGHVMLHSLRRELATGDEVELELEFARAGRVALRVPVVDPAAALGE